MRKQHGFTIVELLIVIVVIAILAAISIVAYNGIQQRAHNTQLIAAAKSYKQAILIYKIDNGEYPPSSIINTYAACLGEGYPDDHCWIGPNGDYWVHASLDVALQEYIGTKPSVPTKYYAITSLDSRAGLLYYPNNVQRSILEYLLDGADQSCRLPDATASNVAQNTATRCRIILPS